MCAGFTFVSHILIITPQAEQITHPKQHFLKNLRYYPHKKHAKKLQLIKVNLPFSIWGVQVALSMTLTQHLLVTNFPSY